MSDRELNPLDPLRRIDVGASPPPSSIVDRARARKRRRVLGVAAAALVVVAGIIAAANLRSTDDATPDVATNPSVPPPAPSITPPTELCSGELPVFATEAPTSGLLAPDEIHGAAGPAPGSTPAVDGQRVVHWLGEFGVAAEVRWPGTPIDDSARTVPVSNPHGLDITVTTRPIDDRFVANILVDSRPGPCGIVSVELFGPTSGPILDSGWAFLTGLHPIADLAGHLAEIDRENAQAPAGDRPLGDCANPIEVDEPEPTDAQVLDLLGRFVADRLAGAAAELCLTVPGITSYAGSQPTETGIPALCLFECPDGTMTAGRLQIGRSGRGPEVLVDYRLGNGTVMKLRETFTVRVTDEGRLLISSATIDVDSWISERLGRRVLSELLDALAAGEWDTAAATLINEGSAIDDPRIGGEEWYAQPYDEAFSRLCATALCGAPYTLGETIDASETFRSIAVTFETADGPVEIPMDLHMFEGVTTAGTLPPDGSLSEQLLPIDERLFAEPYGDRLAVLRDRSVEHRRDGESTWARVAVWPTVGPEFGIAGDLTVVPGNVARSDFHLVVFDGEGTRREIFTEDPDGRLLGAGVAGGRRLAFVTGRTPTELHAIDLDSGEQVAVPCDVCAGGDEQVWFVDIADGHLALGEVSGDSYTTSIHEFDPATLELGERVGFIGWEQSPGEAHLSPDGVLAAAVLFPELNQPSRTVALFDTESGERASSNTWTLEGDATIDSLDYDGRWIVAALSDATTWVIDTQELGPGSARLVDIPARIRFG